MAGETDPFDPLHRASTLSETNLRRIEASIPGGTWHDWDDDLVTECHKAHTGQRYVSVYGRMSWDEPAPTITTQFYGFGNGRFGHPEQNRAISLHEGAILQSFPKTYEFVEPADPIHFKILGRMIGNAVPVLVARAIARTIRHRYCSPTLRTALDCRSKSSHSRYSQNISSNTGTKESICSYLEDVKVKYEVM